MTEHEFYASLKTLLQTDEDIQAETSMQGLEEWDSLAFVLVISFFDKHFAKHITFADLTKCYSASDIAALADGAIA